MEAVVSKVEKPVVHPQGLTEIPSLRSVTQAISVLCKQTEVAKYEKFCICDRIWEKVHYRAYYQNRVISTTG